ncbi:MAG: hypothetical protein Q4G64_08090 [bacterium]|nr:hypothetical protein [bacterium]
MQITRTLPPGVTAAFHALAQQHNLGAPLGALQVNSRDPNKVMPTGTLTSIGFGIISIMIGSAMFLRREESHFIWMGLGGILIALALVVVTDLLMGRYKKRGEEFVAVHEGGLVWAGTGPVEPKVLPFSGMQVRDDSPRNPKPLDGDAPRARRLRLQSGGEKLTILAFGSDEMPALDAIVQRVGAR